MLVHIEPVGFGNIGEFHRCREGRKKDHPDFNKPVRNALHILLAHCLMAHTGNSM